VGQRDHAAEDFELLFVFCQHDVAGKIFDTPSVNSSTRRVAGSPVSRRMPTAPKAR
jgi:hypothetical protein